MIENEMITITHNLQITYKTNLLFMHGQSNGSKCIE